MAGTTYWVAEVVEPLELHDVEPAATQWLLGGDATRRRQAAVDVRTLRHAVAAGTRLGDLRWPDLRRAGPDPVIAMRRRADRQGREHGMVGWQGGIAQDF